ncbi:MAG: response regulator [candidate division Zixibacteria bacterium]|nr:response regulator [Gammaproteobacteria bacterium]NIX54643.1 response regulator [candidate division Zixibacteria bacterium]
MEDRIKVILADDHAVVRSGIRQFLESTGEIEVLAEADNGEEAKLQIQKHEPDVVVLDIQMPEASGIEVTRWLRKTDSMVGVLILTAYDEDPYINAVLQAGANGFVLKTASPEEIVRAVKDVHDGKSVLDPSIAHRVLKKLTKGKDDYLYEPLTDREHEVLSLVAKGFTNKAIGVQLSISDRTVQGHIAHIFTKLQASSRTEAVMKAVSLGWLPADLSKIE